VVEHCLRAEIAEARGTLICIKEHRRVDIRNVLGYEWIYRHMPWKNKKTPNLIIPEAATPTT